MRAFSLTYIPCSIALALVAGCSSSELPFVAKNDFAAQYAAAICDDLGPCCTSAAFAYDASTCRQRVAASLASKLADPAFVYDPEAAAACVGAARDGARGCFLDGASSYVLACGRVFTPTITEGGACTSADECALPLRGGHATCDAGRCVVAHAGNEGDACDLTCAIDGGGERCWSTSASTSTPRTSICFTATGLFCQNGRCARLARLGEPCAEGGCFDGAYCGRDGRCAALGDAGAACARDDECANGARCSGGACAEGAHAGERCASDDACKSGRCVGGVCGPSSAVTADVCGGASAAPDAPSDGGS